MAFPANDWEIKVSHYHHMPSPGQRAHLLLQVNSDLNVLIFSHMVDKIKTYYSAVH